MRALIQHPLAIIDIGSNSARLVVYQQESAGQLRILASARQSLGLVREVDSGGRLSSEALAVTLRTLSEFRSVIRAHGAGRVVAVATAAVRDAENGRELVDRARTELGLRIDVIDSGKEGHYGCIGGIRSLPVNDGVVFDLGGGTVQLVEFRDRRPGTARSLPLGSLRLSQAFIRHDPPTKREVRQLSDHVELSLKDSGIRTLGSGKVLVGVGGSIRNLAKVDAHLIAYPIVRVHGYILSRERLDSIVEFLCRKRIRSAAKIAGLARDREDSIIGGALAIRTIADRVGAREIVVSGQGVREGLVHSLLHDELPTLPKVRETAIAALACRFSTWNADSAERRQAILSKLVHSLLPDVHTDVEMALKHAALLVDIGRSVDFFDRWKHAASMVINTELDGFSHHDILLLSTILADANNQDAGLLAFASFVSDIEEADIRRAAVLLRIADDILQHSPIPGAADFACRVGSDEVQIIGAGFEGWMPRGVGSRFERLFDRRLTVKSVRSRAVRKRTSHRRKRR
jgi:exopolyphosphatase/guanosine-5'-triphosphate,3'-diphosphate pyrophosphatase